MTRLDPSHAVSRDADPACLTVSRPIGRETDETVRDTRHEIYVRTRRVRSLAGAIDQNANRHRRRDQDNAQELVRLALLAKFALDLGNAPLAAKAARYAHAVAARLTAIGDEDPGTDLPEVEDLLQQLRERAGLVTTADDEEGPVLP